MLAWPDVPLPLPLPLLLYPPFPLPEVVPFAIVTLTCETPDCETEEVRVLEFDVTWPTEPLPALDTELDPEFDPEVDVDPEVEVEVCAWACTPTMHNIKQAACNVIVAFIIVSTL